jgi:hypothetical protein
LFVVWTGAKSVNTTFSRYVHVQPWMGAIQTDVANYMR